MAWAALALLLIPCVLHAVMLPLTAVAEGDLLILAAGIAAVLVMGTALLAFAVPDRVLAKSPA